MQQSRNTSPSSKSGAAYHGEVRLTGDATSIEELQPGDILSRPTAIVAEHYGMWTGRGRDPFGSMFDHMWLWEPRRDEVIDIQKTAPVSECADVRITDLKTFASGRTVRVQRPSQVDLVALQARIRAVIAQGKVAYSAIGDGVHKVNCEHLARGISTGKPESGQAVIGGLGVVALALFAAFKLFGK